MADYKKHSNTFFSSAQIVGAFLLQNNKIQIQTREKLEVILFYTQKCLCAYRAVAEQITDNAGIFNSKSIEDTLDAKLNRQL